MKEDYGKKEQYSYEKFLLFLKCNESVKKVTVITSRCAFFPTIESVPDPCDTADRNGGNRVRPSRNSNKRTQKPTPQEQGQKMQHAQSHAEGSDDKRVVVEVDCAISQDGQAGDEPIHEPSATNDIEANEITTAYI